MASPLDTPLRAASKTLIAKFGKACTYIEAAAPTHYPADGLVVENETTHSVTAVMEAVNRRLVDGSRIQATDQFATIAATALTVTPSTTGRLTVDGIEHSIVGVEPTFSGEQVALYRLQLRR